jgi:hypothetical protein
MSAPLTDSWRSFASVTNRIPFRSRTLISRTTPVLINPKHRPYLGNGAFLRVMEPEMFTVDRSMNGPQAVTISVIRSKEGSRTLCPKRTMHEMYG